MTSADRPAGTPVVHLVDDDASSRKAAGRVLQIAGLTVQQYASAQEFLDARPMGPGCIVLDIRMPGPSGLQLQDALATDETALPIVFLSGHSDVPKTARAMKAGAVDFLAKPVRGPMLLDAVTRALARDADGRSRRLRISEMRARYARLTAREREVFAHVISGQLNKQIAFDLGTTEHTIKVHRQRVMEKLEAESVPDLVRFAQDLDVPPVRGCR